MHENNVKVHSLNMAKLNQDVTKDINNGKKYEVWHNWGIIYGKYPAVTMNECVAFTPKTLEDKTIQLDIFEKEDGKIFMFPAFSFKTSIKELEEYTTGEFMTLKEFMGERYNYNGRIQGNTYSLLRYLENGK